MKQAKREALIHRIAHDKARELVNVFCLAPHTKAMVCFDFYLHFKAALEDFSRLDNPLKSMRPSKN